MLSALNRLVIRVSGSPWLFIAVTAVMAASLFALLRIGETGFPPLAGGAQPFDLQNGLTTSQLLEQLPAYTDATRRQYLQFSMIDFVFPLAGGLFIAAVSAFGLRHSFPRAYAALDARRLLPLFMIGTLFDWCENVAALTAIFAWPDTTPAMASAVVIAKRLKLACVFVSQGIALLLLVAAAVRRLARRSARA
jgi:hypothetical protein